MNKITIWSILLVFKILTSASFAQNFRLFDKTTNQTISGFTYSKGNENTYIFSHPDYTSLTKKIENIKENENIDIYLYPSNLKMDEVVISANRFQENNKDVPRQIQTISQRNIRFQNRQNTADLLEQSGNVFVQKSQQGGGSPVLRGFESNKVLLVIDGIRMNNAIYRGGHLQNALRIDQNMLSKAEILFGGGSVIYGSDALGGVMYFETMKPQLNKINHNSYYRYGSVNNESTFHYDVNVGSKKWAQLISLTYSSFGDLKQGSNKDNVDGDTIYQRNYYATRINNRDTMTKNNEPLVQLGTAYYQYDAMYKLLYQAKETQQHIFNFQISNTGNVPRYDRLNEWKGKNYRSAEWYYGPELRTLASYQLNTVLNKKMADKYKLTLAYQYIEESRNDRNWQAIVLNKRNEAVNLVSINLDVLKSIKQNNNSNHEIRYGIDGQYNYVQSTANGVNINTGANSAIPTRYPDGGSTMNYLAAFISHSWEMGKKFVISDGLRFNYVGLNSTFNDKTFYPFLGNTLTQSNTALNGNLGAVYNPIKQLKLYANASTAFRAPNLDDINKVFDSKAGDALITPNPDLKPERTNNFELGFSALIHNKVKLDASIYYTQIQDVITMLPSKLNGLDSAVYNDKNTKVFSYQNAQKGYIYGYSLQVAADVLQNVSFNSSLNYTYGRIKMGNNESPLDHIPPMFGRLAITYHLKKLSIEVSSLYNGWKRIEDFNLAGEDNQVYATPKGSPAWYTLNLKAQYTIDKKGRTQLQLGIDNIMDTQYRVFASGVSAAGRNIWVCFRVKI
jgi:hemoglobin/transferrin/lactoferrin receptor protein